MNAHSNDLTPALVAALRIARADIVALERMQYDHGNISDTSPFDEWLKSNEALPVIDAALAKAEVTP